MHRNIPTQTGYRIMKDYPDKEKKKQTTKGRRIGSRRTKLRNADKRGRGRKNGYNYMPPVTPVKTKNTYEKLEEKKDD